MKKTILVIENDTQAASKISKALEAEGLLVFSAANGGVALTMAKKVKPSAVFLNLATPDTNGLEICKSIHAIQGLETIPIILLTLREGKYDPRYQSLYGIVGFLKKPFTSEDITEKLSTLAGIEGPDGEAAAPTPPKEEEQQSSWLEETVVAGGADDEPGDSMQGVPGEDIGAPAEQGEQMQQQQEEEEGSWMEETIATGAGGEFEEMEEEPPPFEIPEPAEPEAAPAEEPQADEGDAFMPPPAGGGGEEEPELEEFPDIDMESTYFLDEEGEQTIQLGASPMGKSGGTGGSSPLEDDMEEAASGFDDPSPVEIEEDFDFGEPGDIGIEAGEPEAETAAAVGAGSNDQQEYGLGSYRPKKRLRTPRKGGKVLLFVFLGIFLLGAIGGGVYYFFFMEGGPKPRQQVAMSTPSGSKAETPATSARSDVAPAPRSADREAAARPPEPSREKTAEAPKPKAQKQPAPKPSPAPKPAPSKPRSAQTAPSAPASAHAPGESVPSGTTAYYLQFGAFSKQENAREFASDLTSKGHEATVLEGRSGGRRIYRVVGHWFENLSRAENYQREIQRTASLKSSIHIEKSSRAKTSATPRQKKEPASISSSKETVYYLQFGAFSEARNAREFSEKLKARGFSTTVEAGRSGSRTIYRVLGNYFDSRKAAEDFRKNLLESEGIKTAILEGRPPK